MEETPEAQIKRHIEDCATLLAELEAQLPDPVLEWPSPCFAMQSKRIARRYSK